MGFSRLASLRRFQGTKKKNVGGMFVFHMAAAMRTTAFDFLSCFDERDPQKDERDKSMNETKSGVLEMKENRCL